MTRDEATQWAKDMSDHGTYPVRQAYRDQYAVGRIAEEYWNDPVFTLGIEYGMLIAVAKIFGDLHDLPEDE